MAGSRAISLDGSNKYNWDDVEQRSKELGVTVSKYIQTLVEKDIDNKKFEGIISYVTMLLGCCAVILLILLFIYR